MLKNFTLRLLTSCLFTLSLLMLSCTNDAEDMGDALYQPPQVQGTYQLTMLQTDDPSNFNKGQNTSFNLLDEMDCLRVSMQIHEDGTLETTYTDLEIAKDPTSGEYIFNCGAERRSTGTWTLMGSTLKMDTATFIIHGNQLVDARKPESQLFDLVIFTRM